VAKPDVWTRAVGDKFRATYQLAGDSYKRPPAGVDADHALIEDLKRRSFVGMAELSQRSVTSPGFAGEFAADVPHRRTARPLPV